MKKLFFLSLFFVSFQLFAIEPVYTGYFSNNGANGYDVVAYFTQSKPVKGKEEFKTTHQGADWLFSSQENLDAFEANPQKYAPQYGGYCAYAVANGGTASTEPEFWSIRNGKLYLNYSQSVQTSWNKDPDGYIKAADKVWKEKYKFKSLN